MTQTNPKKSDLPQPSGWRILVKVSDLQEKSAGGIFIPEQAKHNERNLSSLGTIVLLGPLAYTRPDLGMEEPWCKEGDTVIFGRYAGSRISLDEQEYRLMNDEEVLAVIPESIKTRVKRV